MCTTDSVKRPRLTIEPTRRVKIGAGDEGQKTDLLRHSVSCRKISSKAR